MPWSQQQQKKLQAQQHKFFLFSEHTEHHHISCGLDVNPWQTKWCHNKQFSHWLQFSSRPFGQTHESEAHLLSRSMLRSLENMTFRYDRASSCVRHWGFMPLHTASAFWKRNYNGVIISKATWTEVDRRDSPATWIGHFCHNPAVIRWVQRQVIWKTSAVRITVSDVAMALYG